MEFGSELVYAPTTGRKDAYEDIPETRYNHVVTGYSGVATAAQPGYEDDGEVGVQQRPFCMVSPAAAVSRRLVVWGGTR